MENPCWGGEGELHKLIWYAHPSWYPDLKIVYNMYLMKKHNAHTEKVCKMTVLLSNAKC